MPVSPLVYKEPVGVIGSGSFAITIAHLLSHNVNVLIYSRRQEIVDEINVKHRMFDHDLHPRISATNDISEIGLKCSIIFPIIPSEFFSKRNSPGGRICFSEAHNDPRDKRVRYNQSG